MRRVPSVTRDRYLSHLLGVRRLSQASPWARGNWRRNSRPVPGSGLFQSLEKPAPVLPFTLPQLLLEICSLLSLHSARPGGFTPESRVLSRRAAAEHVSASLDFFITAV